MPSLRSLVFAALLAGAGAAVALTLAQALWVTPLILAAETYEAGPSVVVAATPVELAVRHAATAVANLGLGFGYALMLGALFCWRPPTGPARGLAWGLAGYAVFFAAPSLGLPPELPGAEAAELGARQSWWLATAAGTATGLGLLCLQDRWPWRLAGVLLLVLPHVLGAPAPAVTGGLAPEDLLHRFQVASLLSNALFWVLLGGLSAFAHNRLCRHA